MYHVCARILNSEGSVLLLKRADTHQGTWEMPGGATKEKEFLVDGLAREVREETGLSCKPEDFIFFHTYFFDKDGKTEQKMCFTIVSDGPIVLSLEHDAFGWFTTKQMKKLTMWPKQKALLTVKLKNIEMRQLKSAEISW